MYMGTRRGVRACRRGPHVMFLMLPVLLVRYRAPSCRPGEHAALPLLAAHFLLGIGERATSDMRPLRFCRSAPFCWPFRVCLIFGMCEGWPRAAGLPKPDRGPAASVPAAKAARALACGQSLPPGLPLSRPLEPRLLWRTPPVILAPRLGMRMPPYPCRPTPAEFCRCAAARTPYLAGYRLRLGMLRDWEREG